MSRHTIVLEFDSGEPSYGASMEVLGGRVVAVAFADELERTERLEAQRDDLLEALEACIDYGVMTGDEWVTDKALSAIAAARGEA